MNIIVASYYYKPHIGGVENSLCHIAQALIKKGNKVFIVASDSDLSKKKRLCSHEIIDGIEVYRFKRFLPKVSLLALFGPFIDRIRASKTIAAIHLHHAIDVILTRNHILGLAGYRVGVNQVYYHVSSIVKKLDKVNSNTVSERSLRSSLVSVYVNWCINPINQFLQNKCIRKATGIIVFSDNLRKQVEQIAPYAKDKIRIIHPGVDIQEVSPVITSVGKRTFVFLVLGRLIYAKRIDLAIDAMAALPDHISVELHIVGDGPVKDTLLRSVMLQKIKHRVLFFEATANVNLHYQKADCFLMTSEYETFGQTIIEAMSFGLPVIAFNSDGHAVQTSSAEIIENGINGFLCDFSVTDLASTMLHVTEMNQTEFKSMAFQNRMKTKAYYSWDNYVEQLMNFNNR